MVVPAGTRRCTCLKKSCGISYRIQNFDKMINGKRSGSTQEAHTNRPSFAYFNTREYCKSIRIKDKQQSTCAKRKISFFKSDLPAVHLIKYMRNILKSVYLIATRDLSNLWLQFFLSQNQGFMRLFEKTVLK